VAERDAREGGPVNVETLATRLLAEGARASYGDTLALLAGLVMAEKSVAATLEDAGVAPSALGRLVAEDARLSAAERLDIYAHMYFYRIHDVLWEYLPRTAALLGEDRFWNLLTAYLQRHPSRHPSLRYVGQDLAAFVREGQEAGAPWLADLIALEWARIDLVDRRDAEVLTLPMAQAWSVVALAALPLRLVPAASVLEVRWAVDDLWRDEASSEMLETVSAGESPRTLLVWRQGLEIFHRRAEVDEAKLLTALREGTTFGALCEAVADMNDGPLEAAASRAFALVARWIGEGLLVAASPPPAEPLGSET